MCIEATAIFFPTSLLLCLYFCMSTLKVSVGMSIVKADSKALTLCFCISHLDHWELSLRGWGTKEKQHSITRSSSDLPEWRVRRCCKGWMVLLFSPWEYIFFYEWNWLLQAFSLSFSSILRIHFMHIHIQVIYIYVIFYVYILLLSHWIF